ncbi:hypothetical protein LCGC14_1377100, partial [marine sediment metagenome]
VEQERKTFLTRAEGDVDRGLRVGTLPAGGLYVCTYILK